VLIVDDGPPRGRPGRGPAVDVCYVTPPTD
jgi:hypothetical protein